jgi:hypothetical protein
MNYIISLSTIPSKFDKLYMTIDSIINQTVLPKKIIINIPKKYSFRMNNSEIPIDKINNFMDKYSKYNVFINIINDDFGPGTKLLGLLNSNYITDIDINSYIILIDDDVIYKQQAIEHFDNYIKSNDNVDDNVDVGSFHVYKYNDLEIGQGVDCFFIKVNSLNKFLQFYNIIKEKDYINYHDDFYISYYFKLINKKIHKITKPKYTIYDCHRFSGVDALFFLKGKYARNTLSFNCYEILDTMYKNGDFDCIKNL